MKNIEDIAREIISNFKGRYLNDQGLISRNYPVTSRTIYDNFDDIAPFFIYFGETDFLLDQIIRIQEKTFEEILARKGMIYSYQIDEYLGGLYCLWKNTRNDVVEKTLKEAIEKIRRYFIHGCNLYGTYNLLKNKRSPHYYYWSSGLLETFIEMGTDYPELQTIAADITDTWLTNPFFLKHHLFPFRYSDSSIIHFFNSLAGRAGRFSRHQPSNSGGFKEEKRNLKFNWFTSGIYVQLMKSNTTFIFTLISLFNRTAKEEYRQAIVKWIQAVKQKMISNGRVYGFYYPGGKMEETKLPNSFIFIDVLMDTYFFVNRDEAYLDLAREIIDTRLDGRWRNGLIPLDFDAPMTHLDSLVDFAISIRRYAELSGHSSYLDYARDIMDKTLDIHQGEEGFYTHVNSSGEPVVVSNHTVDPKYNGLLLKGLVNLLTLDQSIYAHTELHDLLKDR